MDRINSKQNRITLAMMVIFFIGVFMREKFFFSGVKNVIFGSIQTGIWIGLIVVWCILVRHRLIQRGMRKYLTMMCVFMALCFLFRGLKYYIFPVESIGARYCWYLYYIPIMFYPTCSICAMVYMGKREEWRPPLHARFLFVLPTIASILVLTNDIHQLIFRFPKEALVWSDVHYEYGPLFVIPYMWFVICIITIFLIISKRSRIPQKHSIYLKLPLLPVILGLAYSAAYITGHVSFFSDLVIVMGFFTIWTFELAIRQGYIRSNYNYQDIFHHSSIAAQIYDRNRNLIYSSEEFHFESESENKSETKSHSFKENILPELLDMGSYMDGDIHYVSEPIKGGYVVWKEDVSEQIRLQKQLESSNEYLEDKNLVLRKYYETKIERRKLEEQNRLYNEMQNQTQQKLTRMEQLLSEFQNADAEAETEALLSLGIVAAYLKRRNNLIFLAKDNHRIPVSELGNCMKETAKFLEVFGIHCVIHVSADSTMLFEQMVNLYDAFEIVIEETADIRPMYFVTVSREKEKHILRIRISGIEKIPAKLSMRYNMKQFEDGEYLLEIESSGNSAEEDGNDENQRT